MLEVPALFQADDQAGQVAQQAGKDAEHARAHQGVAVQDGDDQHDDGQQQIKPRENLAVHLDFDVLRSGGAAGALLGQAVHQDEHAEVVGHGGDDGVGRDGQVVDAQLLGHDEGADAHDGGHDLAAGGGHGFDGAGFFRSVADLLHHRDGHDAGGGHVGDRGAGDHAHQAGGNDSRLGGAAGGLVGELHAYVDQQLAAAAFREERAEEDEVEQAGAGGLQRGAVDALLGHDHAFGELFQHLLEGLVLGGGDGAEHALRQEGRRPGIGDKGDDKEEQDVAQRAADRFQQQDHDADQGDIVDSDGFMHRHVVAGQTVDVVERVPGYIDDGRENQDVEPMGPGILVSFFVGGFPVFGFALFAELFLIVLIGGVIQEHEGQGKAHMDRRLEHQGELLDQRQVHLEEHENDRDPNDARPADLFAHPSDSPFMTV